MFATPISDLLDLELKLRNFARNENGYKLVGVPFIRISTRMGFLRQIGRGMQAAEEEREAKTRRRTKISNLWGEEGVRHPGMNRVSLRHCFLLRSGHSTEKA